MFKIAALYKFAEVSNPYKTQTEIRANLKSLSIHGTILVGKEGLNGTISGSKKNIDKAITYIKQLKNFPDIFTGLIVLSPIVTISSFNLIFSLTKGLILAFENLTSVSLKFFSCLMYVIALSIFFLEPEIVPFKG